MPRTITVGCGEWGFRHLHFAEHFPLAARLGFHCLEIGIGGGLPGRLPTRVDDGLVAEVARLRDEHGLATPFCCIENDFTLPDPLAHAAMVDEVATQMLEAARLGCTHVRLFAGFTAYDAMTDQIWERLFGAFRRVASRAGGRTGPNHRRRDPRRDRLEERRRPPRSYRHHPPCGARTAAR